MLRGLEIERPGAHFRRQVAFDNFLYPFPDPQLIERLHVRLPVEEKDAGDESVRVPHLLDQLLPPSVGELPVAPVVENPIVEPVLVDGGEFTAEGLVEIVDDLLISAHEQLHLLCRHNRRRSFKLKGQEIKLTSSLDALQYGIAMIHQELNLMN